MKVLDIALKDLSRSFRSAIFLVFGLVLPLLTAGLFYFAFGSGSSDEGGFELPPIAVQVVNLDQGQTGFSAGEVLVGVLENALPGVLQVTEAADAASARTAVDQQQAAVAVILPSELTAAVVNVGGRAAVELYQDPTLSLGPGIVKEIVSQVIDGFSGARIAAGTAQAQLAAQGQAVDASVLQGIGQQYANWAVALGQGQQTGANPLYELVSPGKGQQSSGGTAPVVGLIMAGMMTFYVFFTGAASAQSILTEEEEGTLPRLFTTPTPHASILGGKLLASFVLLTVQVTVLLVASHLIFGIDWGQPMPIILVAVGFVMLAASFGLFITSFLKNTRQAGIIYGGVMTMLGMIGMMSIFTTSIPGAPSPMSMAALLTPQGWAVRGWQLLLEGGGVDEVLLTMAVMLAAGTAFFTAGLLKFRKRYA